MSPPVPVCVLNDTRIDRHHGCERVMQALEQLLTANGCSVIASNPAHQDWEANPAFMQALTKARLIVVNGEGTIHHDRPAGKTLLKIGQWASAQGIPAVLVNAGWEANSAELASLLNNFSLVAVRDTASAQELAAHGQRTRVVPDLSLFAGAPAGSNSPSGAVLFTDSVNRFTALRLERCRQAIGGQTVSIVFPEKGLSGSLRFMRGAIARPDLKKPRQLFALLAMRQRLARQASADTTQFLSQLAQASLLVSGRFHACTLALTTGTPFVAVPSNTGKIAALVADAGLEPWRAHATLQAAYLARAREQGWSTPEKQSLGDYLASARSQAQTLFRDIRSLVA